MWMPCSRGKTRSSREDALSSIIYFSSFFSQVLAWQVVVMSENLKNWIVHSAILKALLDGPIHPSNRILYDFWTLHPSSPSAKSLALRSKHVASKNGQILKQQEYFDGHMMNEEFNFTFNYLVLGKVKKNISAT